MMRIAMAAGAAALLVGVAWAAPSPLIRAAGPAADLQTVQDVVDKVVRQAMAKDRLAGVTVSVVRDGRVIFSKGYGYADVERRVPVNPSKTLFHVGSVTKLFTATATMQLWERHKLSLDEDVGRYLDFKWRRHSDKPVTVTNLMTHTAGFEDSFLGFISDKADLLPLRDVTRSTIPNVRLVRDPGVARSYSNHGVLLEGYVVERVARMPFADYVADAIFKPLGMSRSSVREPLPEDLRRALANGYSNVDGRLKRLPADYINLGPSGSISSTADDMARFMIARLGEGRSRGAGILRPDTAAKMHTCQFIDHALSYSCMGYGFFVDYIKGHRVLQHDGGTFSFISNLVLVPEHDFGVFISVNSPDDHGLTKRLPSRLIGAVFGNLPLPERSATRPFADKASEYEGYYAPMRRPYGGWLKLAGIGTARVSATGDHTLKVEGFDSQWYQVGPAIFRSRHPDAAGISLVFQRDISGRVVAASLGGGYDKVPLHATDRTALVVLAGFAIATASLLALAITRRRAFLTRGGVLTAVASPFFAGFVLFLAGASILTVYFLNEGAVRGYRPPFGADVAVWCFDAMTMMFVVGAYQTVRTWRSREHTSVSRVIAAVFCLSATAVVLFLAYWDLIAVGA